MRESSRGRARKSGESGRLILLADDEAVLRATGRMMLENCGFRVILAEDGTQALELFAQRRDEIALCILDMAMPGLSGSQAAAEIRRLSPEMPIILSSGYDEATANEGHPAHLPNSTFLHKPFGMDALRQALQKALAAGA